MCKRVQAGVVVAVAVLAGLGAGAHSPGAEWGEQGAGAATGGTMAMAIGGAPQWAPRKKGQLRELRINPRDVRFDELLDSLSGRVLYSDEVLALDAAPDEYLVCINRLASRQLAQVVKTYREVFKKPLLSPGSGEPLFDILSGRPLYEDCGREIRDDLAAAVQRFRAAYPGAAFEPVEVRQYVEGAPLEAAALRRINGVERFLGELHLLGLGPKEEEHSRKAILARICPKGMSMRQFEAVIAGVDEAPLDASALASRQGRPPGGPQ